MCQILVIVPVGAVAPPGPPAWVVTWGWPLARSVPPARPTTVGCGGNHYPPETPLGGPGRRACLGKGNEE